MFKLLTNSRLALDQLVFADLGLGGLTRPLNGAQHCFGLTDIGGEREVNEDQSKIADLSRSMVVHHTSLALDDETPLSSGTARRPLLVADGIGGHAAGDRASALAIDTVTGYVLNVILWFFRLHEEHEDELFEELKTANARCQGQPVPPTRPAVTRLTPGVLPARTTSCLRGRDKQSV